MIDYEYICPSCGEPMDVYEPFINGDTESTNYAYIIGGYADCKKCKIRARTLTNAYSSNESAEEELEKAQAAFGNMLKSFGIKKQPKLKPCPVCGGVDFDIDCSEPTERANGKWFVPLAQIKCEGCGMLVRADFAFSTRKSEAERISDLANEAVVNMWNSMEGE